MIAQGSLAFLLFAELERVLNEYEATLVAHAAINPQLAIVQRRIQLLRELISLEGSSGRYIQPSTAD